MSASSREPTFSTSQTTSDAAPLPLSLFDALASAESWAASAAQLDLWSGAGFLPLSCSIGSNAEDEVENDSPERKTARVTSLSLNGLFHPSAVHALLPTVLNSGGRASLSVFPHAPIGRLAVRPVVASRKRARTGRRVQRGKGGGEEEEIREGAERGWEVWVGKEGEGQARWGAVETG